ISYSRGGISTAPLSRYMDILSIAVVANLALATAIVSGFRHRGFGFVSVPTILIWCCIVILGCIHISIRTHRYLTQRKLSGLIEIQNVNAFFATGREQYIIGKKFLETPFPPERANEFVDILRDPTV